ncbi:DUF1328 domain-containing protein [Palleronia sediminis]|uniref:UPF0391 membrane protein E2L08_04220 n=1 Tax=Palleronia sediminis TaxID=2547833 RepID=A0A4R6AF09_9RHOB|nr:DUF1328 family protein [Palleronia sediminis]TDL81867.1 DUF1328 domain-containing protein [Palleronia sediminis]
MLQLILILLGVAAIAAVLGFGRISGVALSAAKILIIIALIVFVLLVLGLISLA